MSSVREKYTMSQNYAALLRQINDNPVGGIAETRVPVNVAKLDKLVDCLTSAGWAAEYHFEDTRHGRVVRLYYSAPEQEPTEITIGKQ